MWLSVFVDWLKDAFYKASFSLVTKVTYKKQELKYLCNIKSKLE